MEDDSVPGLQDVAENETINAHTDEEMSDDNLEDGLMDHARSVPLNVNCSGKYLSATRMLASREKGNSIEK